MSMHKNHSDKRTSMSREDAAQIQSRLAMEREHGLVRGRNRSVAATPTGRIARRAAGRVEDLRAGRVKYSVDFEGPKGGGTHGRR